MTHKLLTDEAVEAANDAYEKANTTGSWAIHRTGTSLAAFIAHHEGERDCERCGGSGAGPCRHPNGEHACDGNCGGGNLSCPDCGGTGKVKLRNLLTLGPEDDQKIGRLIFETTKAWSPQACNRLARSIREAITS